MTDLKRKRKKNLNRLWTGEPRTDPIRLPSTGRYRKPIRSKNLDRESNQTSCNKRSIAPECRKAAVKTTGVVSRRVTRRRRDTCSVIHGKLLPSSATTHRSARLNIDSCRRRRASRLPSPSRSGKSAHQPVFPVQLRGKKSRTLMVVTLFVVGSCSSFVSGGNLEWPDSKKSRRRLPNLPDSEVIGHGSFSRVKLWDFF